MPWNHAFLPNEQACRIYSTFSTNYQGGVTISDPLTNEAISEKGSLTSLVSSNKLHYMLPTEAYIKSTMQSVIDSEYTAMRSLGLSPAYYDPSQVKWAAKKLHSSIKSRFDDFVKNMANVGPTQEPVVYTSVDLQTRIDSVTFDFSLVFPPRLVVPITVTQGNNISELNRLSRRSSVDPATRVRTLVNRGDSSYLATSLDKEGYLKLLQQAVPGVILEASHGCQSLEDLATNISEHDHLVPYLVDAQDFEGNWVRIECGKPKQVW